MNLLKYNTVILDLDCTIWDGCEPKFWAKLLIPPLTLKENSIYDSFKNYITLQNNVDTVIKYLRNNNINVGFLSVGGLVDVPYEKQPSIMCLAMFNLLNFFNYQKTIVFRNNKKSEFFIPNGKTLFIDDDNEKLNDIKFNFPEVDVLSRYSFKNWMDLL